MKIAVSAVGADLKSMVDPRFGRAAFFVVCDTDTGEFKVLENGAAAAQGGAGISAGQIIADNDVEAVVTGNVGPNAWQVFERAGIKAYSAGNVTVGEAVELFKKGELALLHTPGMMGVGKMDRGMGSGMGGGRGQGSGRGMGRGGRN